MNNNLTTKQQAHRLVKMYQTIKGAYIEDKITNERYRVLDLEASSLKPLRDLIIENKYLPNGLSFSEDWDKWTVYVIAANKDMAPVILPLSDVIEYIMKIESQV